MFHHLALFTPFLYIIIGEILPSFSRKMRLKWKTVIFLAAFVSFIALYGFHYRGSVGAETHEDTVREAKMAAQGILNVPLVANIEDKQRKSEHNFDGKKEIKPPEVNAVDKGENNNVIEKEKLLEASPKKKRKVFPEPISLKPQAPKPASADKKQAQQQPPPQPPREVPRPPPAVNKPLPPAVNQPHPQVPVKKDDQKVVVGDIKKQPDLSQHAVQGDGKQEVKKEGGSGKGWNSIINLSVVCCGDRTNETVVMLKSATILTRGKMHFHIFAEDNLHVGIAQRLRAWPTAYQRKMTFDLHPIAFPPGEDPQKWKKVFKMCATQRLFLPDLLPNVDSLLYVDTDILFIRPIEEIYSFFNEFNSTQMAAMTPEHEVKNIGWYNRFARHPYYGETGMNSGIMLMNLTRMRNFGWTQKIVPYYHEYKLKITWGDQDLLNILFHYYPEGMFMYQCEWNYRPDHCMYSNNCKRTAEHGIAMIHGNRGVYHNEKQPAFRAIYESIRDYTFGANLEHGLIQPLINRLSQPNLEKNYCAKAVLDPVTTTLRRYVDNVIPIKTTV